MNTSRQMLSLIDAAAILRRPPRPGDTARGIRAAMTRATRAPAS